MAQEDVSAVENGDAGHTGHTVGVWTLTLGSIGVVFGDIGTSPLYAFREALLAASGHTGPVTPEVVIGVLSMILWSLIIVVSIKYVLLLLRADNNGEGGTLSLMALVQRAIGRQVQARAGARRDWRRDVLRRLHADTGGHRAVGGRRSQARHAGFRGICGAVRGHHPRCAVCDAEPRYIAGRDCLRPGDGGVVRCAGRAGADAYQRRADGAVRTQSLLRDLFHADAWRHQSCDTGRGLSGGDGRRGALRRPGHFGRRPIRIAWFGFVLPALVINYFGQGALVMANPAAIENPFYRMAPEGVLFPLVILATAASVIASQAVITGAFSLARQAVQLGLLPRFAVRHTSAVHAGQIFLPRINFLLLIGVLLLVGLFKTSSGLAAAYGIAVSTTMLVDGVMCLIILWKLWHWKPWIAIAAASPLILVDATFFTANLLKLLDGAWLPLLFGAFMVVMIWTWRRGTSILVNKTRRIEVPLADLVRSLEKRPPHIVPGTAVFLTSDPAFAPTALLHNLKHNKVLHEKNVILTIQTTQTPRVDVARRVTMTQISEKFSQVTLKFGFMESPNVPKALAIARKLGWQFDIMSTSFFVSRRSLKASAQSGMPLWQDYLFIALSRSANDATDYFQIPTGRVVEVGTQVTV